MIIVDIFQAGLYHDPPHLTKQLTGISPLSDNRNRKVQLIRLSVAQSQSQYPGMSQADMKGKSESDALNKSLLDKDWGAKIPDYITKGTFSLAVFLMSLTMRGLC